MEHDIMEHNVMLDEYITTATGRYRKRDTRRYNSHLGYKHAATGHAARLMELGDGMEKTAIMTCLRKAFMETSHVYYWVQIPSIPKFGMLVSDAKGLDKFMSLVFTNTRTVTFHLLFEDEERMKLLGMLRPEHIYHMDDFAFYIDQLIVEFGQVFKFAGDSNALLMGLSKKPANRVSNLELQYLRQIRGPDPCFEKINISQ